MKEITLKVIIDEEEDFNKFISLIAGLKEEVHFIFEVFEEKKK